ncbi:hypothetical protein PLCT2_01522 [Planctomycetaceae bacterium]|nr:hypothetical protein PLCT2_01522 [Planctomycetaceae bacterium]
MPEPARKKDTEKVLPEADALPESSFNNDLSFDEGFGEMTPMAPEPISVRDVPINPDSLSEDSDAPLEMQPDVDIENNNEDESSQQTLASEDEVEDLVAKAQENEALRVAMTAKIGELTVALRQATDEAQRAGEKVRELSQQLQKAAPAGEVTRLRNEVQAALSARSMAEEDVQAAHNEVELARAEVARLHARVVELESEITPPVMTADEQEEARLRAALEEAQGAISRVEHANEELSRKAKEAEARVAEQRRAAEDAREQSEQNAARIEQLERELALAKNELGMLGDQAADVVRRSREIDDRKAELDRVTMALAESQMRLAEAKGIAEGAEARIKEAEARAAAAEEKTAADKKRAADLEREAKEARERLDTEAARSFRLSQRRIPSLQNEIAAEHAQNMELRRKIEKIEAEKRVIAEQQKESAAKAEELERALAAAKARMSDTEIIRAGASPSAAALADEEIARLAARVKASDEERKRQGDMLERMEQSRKEEMRAYEQRLAQVNAQADEKLEQLLAMRKQARALASRLAQAMKLAELLADARSAQEKQPLLERIAEIAKEAAEPVEAGAQSGQPRVTSAEPATQGDPDNELKLERELDTMPDLPDMKEE